MPPPELVVPPACKSLADKAMAICPGEGDAGRKACEDARDLMKACVRNPPKTPEPAGEGASPGYLDQAQSGLSSMFSYDKPTSADGDGAGSYLDRVEGGFSSMMPSFGASRRPPAPNPTPGPAPGPPSAPAPTVFWTTNTIITVSVLFGVVGILGYWFLGRSQPLGPDGLVVPTGQRAGKFIMYSTIVLLLGFGIYFIYWGVTGDSTQSGNLAGSPVSSSSTVSVPEGKAPPAGGDMGGDYGIQWWMFINDWDYKFGEKKPVIRRGADGIFNPDVFLDPTENTLSTKISVFPGQDTASGSEPAPVGSDGSASSGTFTCSVPNVPLQRWFAVSLSVSGRNVDMYLDGLLVRSCLLPGVPRRARGNIEIMPGGGFSGSVIDLYHYSRSLVPADAQKFAAAGTNGSAYNALPSKSLFGYTVKLGVLDDSGKEIKNYVL